MFEANACGLPVIAVKHPVGIDKELLEEGKTGYFVDVSAKAIAEKAPYILKNEKLRKSMRNNAVEFAKNFDWDNISKMVEGVYRSRV